MLSYNLNILQLRVGIDILTLIRMVHSLFVELVDQVANVVDKLFLLNNWLRSIGGFQASHLLLQNCLWSLSRIDLFLLPHFLRIVLIVRHIMLRHLLNGSIILILVIWTFDIVLSIIYNIILTVLHLNYIIIRGQSEAVLLGKIIHLFIHSVFNYF